MKFGAFLFKGKPLSNMIDYFREKQGLRMFWDCNVWDFHFTNVLGQPTPPQRTYIGPSLVFKRPDSCYPHHTNYIFPYQEIQTLFNNSVGTLLHYRYLAVFSWIFNNCNVFL